MIIEQVQRIAAHLVYVCAAVAFTPGAHAADSDHWHFNAFGTLGATYSSDDKVKFTRDFFQTRGAKGKWSAEPDSVLGAQLSFRPSPEWEAVLQLVSRHDSTRDYDPRVTWAFLKYQPDPAFSLRLGRIGYDIYSRADSRNVGYSYVTVRQPIEYYGVITLTHLDGGDFEYTTPLAGGLFSLKLFGGEANEKSGGRSGMIHDISGTEAYGGYLDYQRGNWQFRAGSAFSKIEGESPSLQPLLSALRGSGSPALAALADDLAFDGARVKTYNLSAYYDRGALQLQLLYNRRQSETISLSDGDAYYALGGYRFARLTPYLGYVHTNGESSPSDFSPLPPQQAQTLAKSTLLEQRTWLAGLRYDFAPNMDLKLQVERVNAPEPMGGFFEPDPGWDGDTTVVSVTLDFIY